MREECFLFLLGLLKFCEPTAYKYSTAKPETEDGSARQKQSRNFKFSYQNPQNFDHAFWPPVQKESRCKFNEFNG